MKKRIFTKPLTLFTTPDQFQKIQEVSDRQEISKSELIREAIDLYLSKPEIQDLMGDDQEVDDGNEQ